MAKQQQRKSGGGKKIGREARHPSHVHYKNYHIRERNKLKRILKSNGIEAAKIYAKSNELKLP